MQSLHDEMKQHAAVCKSISNRLDDLSKSAHDMGMGGLSENLAFLCDHLAASTKDMEKMVSRAIVQRLTDSEMATVNMIEAVIAAVPAA